MKSYNYCKQSKQFLLHQKSLNIQTIMIIIKIHDSENINISNMMLEWQNPLCSVFIYFFNLSESHFAVKMLSKKWMQYVFR